MNSQIQQLKTYVVVDNDGTPIHDKSAYYTNILFYIKAFNAEEANNKAKKIEDKIGTSDYRVKYLFTNR
jgi:hypothetical protein